MSDIEAKWTVEEVNGDSVSKKDLVSYLQESGNNDFLVAHKLNGKLASVVKTAKKPALVAAYKTLFETKQFRSSNEAPASEVKKEKTVAHENKAEKEQVVEEAKYTKKVSKKGSGDRMPKKGDRVSVFYTGRLENGTEFDSNVKAKGRKAPTPLVFKVGTGRVIRGWDEALMTMVKGEKATLTIQPDWAYGQRGVEAAGIPPNATLIFDVELVDLE
ncbi:FK506-binding protein 2B [Coemansia sp. RSA 1813]|nr:FK506-binding protein 2B [Coemansia sp. RSA 1646]KAJ1773497.1 FK506-binding protein 2B [Coemansia sp. RSA 1843]KAJ2085871.1 FK506-binding protein 2B [Coemansia sp. RSA 986]KAJ2216409.1 FK506-binding protein 2B [Coemansia sp. RSA 487]KAJ2570803.1 FK506-binding protein 2B [Coemansia sp. RSA 1813]